jgi:hypothetical protein
MNNIDAPTTAIARSSGIDFRLNRRQERCKERVAPGPGQEEADHSKRELGVDDHPD